MVIIIYDKNNNVVDIFFVELREIVKFENIFFYVKEVFLFIEDK